MSHYRIVAHTLQADRQVYDLFWLFCHKAKQLSAKVKKSVTFSLSILTRSNRKPLVTKAIKAHNRKCNDRKIKKY